MSMGFSCFLGEVWLLGVWGMFEVSKCYGIGDVGGVLGSEGV